MRIRELKLIRYGKFTDCTIGLPLKDQDIHIIVGPNEAGKSTVRTAIADWLFGIPTRTSLDFLHAKPELRLGGTIEHSMNGAAAPKPLAFDRIKGSKNTLRTPQDSVLPDATLQPWLGAMQADAFKQMYALDHDMLVKGGHGILQASDDVGQMLFQSAAGIEHLGVVLHKLQSDADALWAPRKSATRLYYKARDAYDAATAELKKTELRTRDWKAHSKGLDQTRSALAEARGRDTRISTQISQLERVRRIAPILQELDGAQLQYSRLLEAGDIALLPDDAGVVLAQAQRTMAVAHDNLARLQQEIAQTQDEYNAISVDENILARANDITELDERRLQFRAYRTDMAKRQEEIRVQFKQVQDLATGLGWPALHEDAVRARLPAMSVRTRLVRLLGRREQLAQNLHQSQSQLVRCQQQVHKTQRALDDLGKQQVAPNLAVALEQARALGGQDAALRDLNQRALTVAQKIDTALAALGSWRVAPDTLAAILVPDVSQVQTLQEQQRSAATDVAALRQNADDKAAEITNLELALQQLIQAFQPVSLEDVLQARHVRDQAWRHIKTAPQSLDQQAPAFEEHLAKADNLADARHDRAQHEAKRQADAAHIEQQRLQHSKIRSQLADAQARMQGHQTQWNTLAADCGLPGLPLDAAVSWLQQRQAVLGLVQDQMDIARQQHANQQASDDARNNLWAILTIDSAVTPPSLAECVRRAQLAVQAADQAQGQRETLQRQLQQSQDSLPALQENVQSAQNAWADWQSSWQAAAHDAGYDAGVSVDQVDAEIDAMKNIERLLGDILRVRTERIDTMQADLDGLAATAQALAQRVDPTLVDQPPEDISLALAAHLKDAQQSARQSAQLHAKLLKDRAEFESATQTLRAQQAVLAPMMATAGVSDIEALPAAVARSDQRRELEGKIATAQQSLAQSGDGLPEQALRDAAAQTGPDELKAQLDALAGQSTAVVEEIAELSTAVGTQSAAFDLFDGANHAATAEAKRQEAIADMADAVQRYIRLCTALRLLKWAIERFRETQQGPLLARASAMFNVLTVGSFDRLVVDTEGAQPKLIGIRPSRKLVEVDGMSDGSRDQLYLALRLAALEQQAGAGTTFPFIADDLFINFDDNRTRAGLTVLAELSRHVQVIVLTHHDHLVPLAQQALGADVNVVNL